MGVCVVWKDLIRASTSHTLGVHVPCRMVCCWYRLSALPATLGPSTELLLECGLVPHASQRKYTDYTCNDIWFYTDQQSLSQSCTFEQIKSRDGHTEQHPTHGRSAVIFRPHPHAAELFDHASKNSWSVVQQQRGLYLLQPVPTTFLAPIQTL